MGPTTTRVGELHGELASVGVEEFCRRRYEREGMPVKLMRNLGRAPLVTEQEVSRGRVHHKSTLTPLRMETLRFIAQGYEAPEMAAALGITSPAAADRIKRVIYHFRAATRPHAVHVAHQQGLLADVPPGLPRQSVVVPTAVTWTERRITCLRLTSEGLGAEQIAAATGSTVYSVRDALRCAYHLLNARDAANAVHRAHLDGVIS